MKLVRIYSNDGACQSRDNKLPKQLLQVPSDTYHTFRAFP